MPRFVAALCGGNLQDAMQLKISLRAERYEDCLVRDERSIGWFVGFCKVGGDGQLGMSFVVFGGLISVFGPIISPPNRTGEVTVRRRIGTRHRNRNVVI